MYAMDHQPWWSLLLTQRLLQAFFQATHTITHTHSATLEMHLYIITFTLYSTPQPPILLLSPSPRTTNNPHILLHYLQTQLCTTLEARPFEKPQSFLQWDSQCGGHPGTQFSKPCVVCVVPHKFHTHPLLESTLNALKEFDYYWDHEMEH